MLAFSRLQLSYLSITLIGVLSILWLLRPLQHLSVNSDRDFGLQRAEALPTPIGGFPCTQPRYPLLDGLAVSDTPTFPRFQAVYCPGHIPVCSRRPEKGFRFSEAQKPLLVVHRRAYVGQMALLSRLLLERHQYRRVDMVFRAGVLAYIVCGKHYRGFDSRVLARPQGRVTRDRIGKYLGGGGSRAIAKQFHYSYLANFQSSQLPFVPGCSEFYLFHRAVHVDEALPLLRDSPSLVAAHVPQEEVLPAMSVMDLTQLAIRHRFVFRRGDTRAKMQETLKSHMASCKCPPSIFVFRPVEAKVPRKPKKENPPPPPAPLSGSMPEGKTPKVSYADFVLARDAQLDGSARSQYPPPPPSLKNQERIVRNFCANVSPSNVEEGGCKVCGQLTPLKELADEGQANLDLSVLVQPGTTRVERSSLDQPIRELDGPVVDSSGHGVCPSCVEYLRRGCVPPYSLANGMWVGPVPGVLKELTFAEKMLVARVRHNRCLVKVASGRMKMIANAVMFANPTAKVYQVLPPARDDLEQVLAFIFIGSAFPTPDEVKRSPMLVRRNHVWKALEWLKINHEDYSDLVISEENLSQYPVSGVPVSVDFRWCDPAVDPTNKEPSEMSKHEVDISQGTEKGPCPFVVRGLTGPEYVKMSLKDTKAAAFRHLEKNRKMLAIGHEPQPQSMYNNPRLYPQVFPWLFPYGKGGLNQKRLKGRLSEKDHKRRLLMYHDKRFQTDTYFPMVAFNHEQIKSNVTGSFIVARRMNFDSISSRYMNIDTEVLANIAERSSRGELVKPSSDAEKACFSLLEEIDHVGAHSDGFLTGKKHMRNEIWSVIANKGAPNWFITFSPADSRHPLCLYYAGSDIKFDMQKILPSGVRDKLIMSNPVAAARFFDLLVRLVIKHVFGFGAETDGFYGRPCSYYGTVEQQGRLTLHMHMMLWIKGALSPKQIRERLLKPDPEFERSLIAYLESVHQGDFIGGALDDMRAKYPRNAPVATQGVHALVVSEGSDGSRGEVEVGASYSDPTFTLPLPPPPEECSHEDYVDSACKSCVARKEWWDRYRFTTDDLLYKSNLHSCRSQREALKASAPGSEDPIPLNNVKGCLDKDGICSARFPRDVYPESKVDPEDGHIFFKKLEPMINTFTPLLTYLLRCNTDVSGLNSGTSVQEVVKYVTDYITKVSLKTHHIFSAALDVFQRNEDLMREYHCFDGEADSDAARKLLLKITNALTAKMEIGSPMASLYLLDNPDHYTNHTFNLFYWRKYVNAVQSFWIRRDKDLGLCPASQESADPFAEEKVVVDIDENGEVIAKSNVDDYMYRPREYSDVCLYDWIQYASKRKIPKSSSKKVADGGDDLCSSYRYFRFLDEHSQCNSHDVRCQFELDDPPLPNIIGGMLPRSDQGDREYYCMTMLTLFKPWRTGKELKDDKGLWDEAFRAYDFSSHARRLMDNFQIKYQCIDSRDRLKSQHKKKHRAALPQGIQSDDWNDYEETFEDGLGEYINEDGYVEDDRLIGSKHRNRLLQMAQGEIYAKAAGLFDPLSKPSQSDPGLLERFSKEDSRSFLHSMELPLDASDIPEGEAVKQPHILCSLPGAQWKRVVKEKRGEVLARKMQHAPSATALSKSGSVVAPSLASVENDVKLVGMSWMRRGFKAQQEQSRKIIDSVVEDFSLNKEQERAFRIVANHAATTCPAQLKMYLGGMGGTGKSQVIKSLIEMFTRRNERHRFIVLAPTGTAAALLNGSTYHSMLGVNTHGKDEDGSRRSAFMSVNDARDRLRGVNYIFIDEISMVSCQELFEISARLAAITTVEDEPFGGINMIFAGDFAQLPPTGGSALYGKAYDFTHNANMKLREQKGAIGKLLWHQVTTVVILRQNMRQKSQSRADAALRAALENMRYGACTQDDLMFLYTRIANRHSPLTSLSLAKFRNISVITALNSTKDAYNRLGVERFARETGQEVHDFYSVDTATGIDEDGKKIKRGGQIVRVPLTKARQMLLWNSHPHTSEHIPGKLSLCVGLPVMLRHNDATELCITKGQEGHVIGWDSGEGLHGTRCLETVYVKLHNPPQPVQLPHLPTNVVPIVKSKTKITCDLPTDKRMPIEREQVNILPNFGMTDYASQGKTRKINIVDLSMMRLTQAVYTALSRSSDAEGTVIVQSFDASKVTQGISGYLRQEFRETMVLDRITELRYEGMLPPSVKGMLRYPLIRSYKNAFKKEALYNLNSESWHPSLRYQYGEDFTPTHDGSYLWDEKHTFKKHIEEKMKAKKSPPTKKKAAGSEAKPGVDTSSSGTAPVKPTTQSKRKRQASSRQDVSSDAPRPQAKRPRESPRLPSQTTQLNVPLGLVWDSRDYSCAYDALLTVLYNLWVSDRSVWSPRFGAMGLYMQQAAIEFHLVFSAEVAFERCRDSIRSNLTQDHPHLFPVGTNYTSIESLLDKALKKDTFASTNLRCTHCNFRAQDESMHVGTVTSLYTNNRRRAMFRHGPFRLSDAVYALECTSSHPCPSCHSLQSLRLGLKWHKMPNILVFELIDPEIVPDLTITAAIPGLSTRVLTLRGLIYFRDHHFICRVVDAQGRVWFHDGISTGRQCRFERRLGANDDLAWLRNCEGRRLSYVLYG